MTRIERSLRRRAILAGLMLFIMGVLAVQPAHANDLLRSYVEAQSQDASLQAADAARAAAVEARPQALAAWLPQLSVEASAGRSRLAYEVVPDATDVPGAAASLRGFYGHTLNYGLSLSQTLWSTTAFRQLGKADLQVAQAEATYRGAQQDLILRVAQAYFAVLSAQDRVDTQQRQRAAFAALLQQAQVLQQTGIKPRTDVEDAQAFYDATARGLIDAESALADAQRQLAVLTGGSSAASAQALRDEIPLQRPDPDDVQSWVGAAQDDNYALRAAALRVQAAEREVGVQRAARLPTLSVDGNASRTRQSDALGGDQDDTAATLNLKWPIWQGGAVASHVRQAQALYLQARAELSGMQRDTVRQVHKSFRDIVAGVERIRATQAAAQSAATAVEANRRGVEFATRSEFDLLNTQNNYYAALSEYRQSRYDYLEAVLTLKQLAGRLREDDLAAIDQLLVAGNESATTSETPHVP